MDFEKLARQHQDAIYRQMVRMCGNREDAEDVLAEALVQAYHSLDQLEEEAAFRGWLAIIARRLCGRLKRREALLPLLRLTELSEQGIEPASPEPTPEEQALHAETMRGVHAVIAGLPPLYREVYEMADVDEIPLKTVAEKLRLTLSAVKSRLHRARALVRENFDRQLFQPV